MLIPDGFQPSARRVKYRSRSPNRRVSAGAISIITGRTSIRSAVQVNLLDRIVLLLKSNPIRRASSKGGTITHGFTGLSLYLDPRGAFTAFDQRSQGKQERLLGGLTATSVPPASFFGGASAATSERSHALANRGPRADTWNASKMTITVRDLQNSTPIAWSDPYVIDY